MQTVRLSAGTQERFKVQTVRQSAGTWERFKVQTVRAHRSRIRKLNIWSFELTVSLSICSNRGIFSQPS